MRKCKSSGVASKLDRAPFLPPRSARNYRLAVIADLVAYDPALEDAAVDLKSRRVSTANRTPFRHRPTVPNEKRPTATVRSSTREPGLGGRGRVGEQPRPRLGRETFGLFDYQYDDSIQRLHPP